MVKRKQCCGKGIIKHRLHHHTHTIAIRNAIFFIMFINSNIDIRVCVSYDFLLMIKEKIDAYISMQLILCYMIFGLNFVKIGIWGLS